MVNEQNTGWGIASLVLAILSIVLVLIPFVGIVMAVLSLIFYKVQKEDHPTSLATAGMIIGIIGFILNAIFISALFAFNGITVAGQAIHIL